MDVPEIDLTDPVVLHDPYTAYAQVRELSAVVRLLVPGFGPFWAVTRHEEARAMLADPRMRINEASYLRPDVPEHCRPYLRTMSETNGAEHARLRRLVAPAFTPRKAGEFAARVERIVEGLLDELPEREPVDLLERFAKPLPIDAICELVGIPPADRPRWREYGAAIAAGHGERFARSIPEIIGDARSAIAAVKERPGDGLLSDLARVVEEDGDRLSDDELVTMVWLLVLAGQTPANLIANAVATLLAHPDQLAALRADPALMPRAVDELARWSPPQPMTVPRFPAEDVEIGGVPIPEGQPVTVSVASANRDPRVFDEPDRFDIGREPGPHLGFGHGPHFCVGSSLARMQTGVALGALLRRFPDLALAGEASYLPDPGTRRLASLPVTLRPAG
ncbi:cytochrome P450 [Nonomuraea thailandensis]|uniref:Cytochrome P450 n=1 Tax=Nonomuraea thailandensis TaxID=1188745 RepID=A0A9X2GJ69_9ACTN|nr:cytochrome P450 [Nonomuraea thailandensis]MCP2356386.1 cytochrome P450 [Nonomuraea thailandensis]